MRRRTFLKATALGGMAYLIYKEAVIHFIAGKQAEGMQSLRDAFQKGYPPDEARNDPELKELRTNPEFDKLLKEFSRKTN